jgi:hypothetical protein
VACHESGNECTLTKSRRGGNFRHYRTEPRLYTTGSHNTLPTQPDNISGVQRDESPDDEGSVAGDDSRGVLALELRNPSDALHILALSGNQHGACHSAPGPNGAAAPIVRSSTATALVQPLESQNHVHSVSSIFDDYELVQKGLLRPSLVFELLLQSVMSVTYGVDVR